mmetsp:Transcript_10453/g.20600  ORF Transcript_10453/g.20600 Transcript_10453/m.20600 type:complete len:285 (-) Transcript_10453:426-1280(-)
MALRFVCSSGVGGPSMIVAVAVATAVIFIITGVIISFALSQCIEVWFLNLGTGDGFKALFANNLTETLEFLLLPKKLVMYLGTPLGFCCKVWVIVGNAVKLFQLGSPLLHLLLELFCKLKFLIVHIRCISQSTRLMRNRKRETGLSRENSTLISLVHIIEFHLKKETFKHLVASLLGSLDFLLLKGSHRLCGRSVIAVAIVIVIISVSAISAIFRHIFFSSIIRHAFVIARILLSGSSGIIIIITISFTVAALSRIRLLIFQVDRRKASERVDKYVRESLFMTS